MEIYEHGNYLFCGEYRKYYRVEYRTTTYIFTGEIIDKGGCCVLFKIPFGNYYVIRIYQNYYGRQISIDSLNGEEYGSVFGNSAINKDRTRILSFSTWDTAFILCKNEDYIVYSDFSKSSLVRDKFRFSAIILRFVAEKRSSYEIIGTKIYEDGKEIDDVINYKWNTDYDYDKSHNRFMFPSSFIPAFYQLQNDKFKKLIFAALMCLRQKVPKFLVLMILSYL